MEIQWWKEGMKAATFNSEVGATAGCTLWCLLGIISPQAEQKHGIRADAWLVSTKGANEVALWGHGLESHTTWNTLILIGMHVPTTSINLKWYQTPLPNQSPLMFTISFIRICSNLKRNGSQSILSSALAQPWLVSMSPIPIFWQITKSDMFQKIRWRP